jgi:spore germination protein GerM
MPKSNREQRKSKSRPWRRRLILLGALVVVLFGIGLVIGYFKATPPPQPEPVAVTTEPQPTREMILYFASADGQTLVAENRDIEECQTDEDCLRKTVEALIAGPQSDLVPILPDRVVLRGVTSSDSLVSIDFSQELVAAHPGGTQSELLTIYGLADTLAVNFPHLRQVRILVDGARVPTLKGHVDLRQPVNPDFSLVKEDLSPSGKMLSLPVERDE